MERLRMKTIRLSACLLISVSILLNAVLYVKAQTQEGKEKAVSWLKESGGENGEWEDNGLPGHTCNAMAVLREEGTEADSAYLKKWEQEHSVHNVDELSHLAWAWKNREYLKDVWKWQNEDGGFGLTREYTSDVYDTMLVLLAETATGKEEASIPGRDADGIQKAAAYLMGQQREDGSFGYTGKTDPDPGLSAEIGLVLLSLDMGNDAFYEKLDRYCKKVFQADFSEEAFHGQAELARYLYKREQIENADDVEKSLHAVQKEDGSVYGSAGDTIQYILLVKEAEEYHALRFGVDSLVTEADSYVLEADKEQQVSLQTTVQYTANREMKGIMRYTLLEDGEIIKTEEKDCSFVPDRREQKTDAVMDVTAGEGKEYVLRTEVVSREDTEKETVWESTEFAFTVHKTEEKEFILQAEVTGQDDYGVDLSWNDISDGDNRYGYRVFRKKGEGEWETRSTWDGSEKVKVLNIYPCAAAEDYLVKWMEETISDTEEPAGKGLFEIDTVYIEDYNKDPYRYLLDAGGDYKYDVLLFGTYDANASRDLTDYSYQATSDFMDTGRGVLFGHDTVAEYAWNSRMQFRRFGERMGVKMISDNYLVQNNKVKVVNNGFLTSYPWKLTGILNIPTAHPAGLYAGGNLSSTVWLEFQGDYLTDAESGAKNSAYLFTKDAIAMIQTGHSNGQATDDERKVIANTLFYLKQLTYKTGAPDKSFYDETGPEVTGVSGMTPEGQVRIDARDHGTLYRYYVEAVNAGNREEEGRQSNIVEAEALSGIKGYIIGMSDTEAPMEELLSYDEEGAPASKILPAAEDGSLSYTPEAPAPGEIKYLHIYAVDHAGNISEEKVCKVTAAEAGPDKEYFDSPYALFASEKAAEASCCEAGIRGDVYGKEAFRFQGTALLLEGKASTAGSLSLAGGRMELAEKEEKITPVILPDYTKAILQDMETESDAIEELNAYDSTEITVPTICKSTTGAWCNDVRMKASLVSEKTVSLNANTISCGTDDKVVLCSRNGDIRVQATKFEGKGLIYAPNGTVTINVSQFNYRGTIIAKEIKVQAGYINLDR